MQSTGTTQTDLTHQHGRDVVESILSNVVGGEIEYMKTFCLLCHTRTDVSDASILKVVVPYVQDPEGVVSTED